MIYCPEKNVVWNAPYLKEKENQLRPGNSSRNYYKVAKCHLSFYPSLYKTRLGKGESCGLVVGGEG